MTEIRAELELLERDDELAVLAEHVEATRAGEGSLVVIEGTAGIGKTRLLREARTRAAGELRVLSARGGEHEGEFAFGVVRQLFEPLLATAAPETRTEFFSGAATLAEPLFDPAAVANQPGSTDASFAMLHGLYWLAANVAFERPTTKDFVWPCWGGGIRLFGVSFCFNFVFFLLVIAFAGYMLLFVLAFRKPKVVPGKFQVLMESGIGFVRDQITLHHALTQTVTDLLDRQVAGAEKLLHELLVAGRGFLEQSRARLGGG